MSLAGNLRTIRLLGRLLAPNAAQGGFEEWPIGEIPCDWYEARGRRRAVVVALHGVTPNGKDDHRLRAFARKLASSGTSCAVPDVPGLRKLRWDPADVSAIGRVVEAASEATSSKVVVVGFSHGASLGLVAAARPEWSSFVEHVIAIGAYHSLDRVLDGLASSTRPPGAQDFDDWVYAQLVTVQQWGAALGVASEAREAAWDLLLRYCEPGGDDEKRRFFERHLDGLDVLRRARPRYDPRALAGVSPAGQLEGLSCSVGLVHDPGDFLVPVSEGRALLDELRRGPAPTRHRLLVTGLMRHVTPAGALRLGEALTLVQMMSPLVGG